MSGYFLPHIERMAGYVPGEQPQGGDVVKLNTNENPYPPSPRVAEAIARVLAGERLRLYPDPIGSAFRRIAGALHGVDPSWVLVGNGSDDLLTILIRAFVGPGDVVVYNSPSYILYRTLVELQAGRAVEVPYSSDWDVDPERLAHPEARLAFLANPNSPSGTRLDADRVARIAERLPCPLVVDEAYADFADGHCMGLVSTLPNVIVTRSLSKGYGLAGLRVGYLVARPEIIEGLVKVKDSYNCDALSLVGGAAALEDREYLHSTRSRILATRARLAEAMRARGFDLPDSQANFVWCTGPRPAGPIYQALKDQNILVRWMRYPGLAEGLRITVGTDAEIDHFLTALDRLL